MTKHLRHHNDLGHSRAVTIAASIPKRDIAQYTAITNEAELGAAMLAKVNPKGKKMPLPRGETSTAKGLPEVAQAIMDTDWPDGSKSIAIAPLVSKHIGRHITGSSVSSNMRMKLVPMGYVTCEFVKQRGVFERVKDIAK